MAKDVTGQPQLKERPDIAKQIVSKPKKGLDGKEFYQGNVVLTDKRKGQGVGDSPQGAVDKAYEDAKKPATPTKLFAGLGLIVNVTEGKEALSGRPNFVASTVHDGKTFAVTDVRSAFHAGIRLYSLVSKL